MRATDGRWILIVVIAAAAAWEMMRAVRGYRMERVTLYPPRGPVLLPADAASLGITDVSFPSRNGTRLAAWYVPSRDGSAIVIAHGSGSTRASMIDEVRVLAAAGHGILAFDFAGHGESGGIVELGAAPAAAVEGAVDYLQHRKDVQPDRIGALGFSFGGMAVTRAAAADCRIRAVALVATPSDAEAQTRAEYRGAGPAAILGALAVYRFRGIDLEMERPLTFIASIAPRPVAIFAGTEDRTVPFEEGRELFAAARQPKEFHRIEHGDHGQYARSDSTYAPALRRFFASALAGPAATTECSR